MNTSAPPNPSEQPDSQVQQLLEQKLRLEIEKLQADIYAIKHPLLYNPGYFILLIITCIALGTAAFNWDAMKIKDNLDGSLKQMTIQLAQKNAEMEKIRSQIESYQREADNLRQSNNDMRNLLSSRGEISEEERKMMDESENASYIIHYRMLDNHTGLQDGINTALKQLGFNVVIKTQASNENLSAQSAVFFYDTQSEAKAKELATILAQVTGVAFTTMRGNGKGIAVDRLRWTLVVHHTL